MEKLSVIRIVIAHHEQIFREGLRLLLGSEPGFVVVGDAPNGAGAVRMVRDLRPDVLLVDLALPEGGINVLKKLTAMPGRVRAIAMTASADEDMLIAALEQGARGLIVKESPTALLFKSIRTVLADQVWIGAVDHEQDALLDRGVFDLLGLGLECQQALAASPFGQTHEQRDQVAFRGHLLAEGHPQDLAELGDTAQRECHDDRTDRAAEDDQRRR